MLGAEGGRRKMLGRLGTEAADALDEFLAAALDYESRHTPTLQGFVAWLRASDAQVKRDMDIARDEVRVMTVHGAKGLEASVVILADTMTPPAGPRDPRLLGIASEGRDGSEPLVWAGPRGDDVHLVAQARARAQRAAEDEHHRLLYVAMTRAANRLVICGAEGQNGRPEGCWYTLIHTALAPELVECSGDADGTVWRWRKSADALPTEAAAGPNAPLPVVTEPSPAWLSKAAETGRGVALSVAPSAAVPSRPLRPRGAGGAANPKARARGDVVHRLLYALPELPAPERHAAAQRFFATLGDAFTPAEIAEIGRQVFAIVDHANFAPLFAAGTQGEVPIVGRLAGVTARITVSGRIDRLAVTADEVLIADYKSDRAPPSGIDGVPEPYQAQLALYRAVLQSIYPGRPVRAALIWTATAELIEIPPARLDAMLALAGLRAP
jgi:ATP-dependent helicase/nuclease subunit A